MDELPSLVLFQSTSLDSLIGKPRPLSPPDSGDWWMPGGRVQLIDGWWVRGRGFSAKLPCTGSRDAQY